MKKDSLDCSNIPDISIDLIKIPKSLHKEGTQEEFREFMKFEDNEISIETVDFSLCNDINIESKDIIETCKTCKYSKDEYLDDGFTDYKHNFCTILEKFLDEDFGCRFYEKIEE